MDRQSNRRQWRERVRRWKDGGLTAQQFASEMGLNYHTLLWWSSQLKREDNGGHRATEQQRKPQFIELTEALIGDGSVAMDSGLELLVSDVLIKVPVGFDEQTLRRLLLVIRQP